MGTFDVVIIGGGIAGLAAAWQLSRSGSCRVCLLEQEPTLASHASGRNAAIFRHLDDACGSQLSLRSRELFSHLASEERPVLLRPGGALFIGSRERLAPLAATARQLGLGADVLSGSDCASRSPALAGGEIEAGLFVPEDGVLDVHALCEALARQARAAGAEIVLGSSVRQVLYRGDRAVGVRRDGGEEVSAGAVVIAAGAWAGALGEAFAAPLPIRSFRRHLALLVAEKALPANSPVVWQVGAEELYFRPESGAVLASPCDEEPWPPGTPPCSAEALAQLHGRLARVAPALAMASVRRAWACLRTFAPDRSFVVGEDPRHPGLFWIGGLGGRGMSSGVALGEVLATQVLGQPHPLAALLGPARLLDRSESKVQAP